MSNSHNLLSSVSLIIPAYNDETTVGRLIGDSTKLLERVCPDYEIIVTNDGSRDNTLFVLREFASVNPRIRVINHEVNRGFGSTIK